MKSKKLSLTKEFLLANKRHTLVNKLYMTYLNEYNIPKELENLSIILDKQFNKELDKLGKMMYKISKGEN